MTEDQWITAMALGEDGADVRAGLTNPRLVSTARLTPLQIAEAKAGCLGQWIQPEGSDRAWVLFDTEEDARRAVA